MKFLDGVNTRLCNENNPRYIGCYADDRYRDLDERPRLKNALQRFTISSCNNECQGYLYFSLQFGGQCFCGDAYNTAPKYKKGQMKSVAVLMVTVDFGGIRFTRHVVIKTNLDTSKNQDEDFGWFQTLSKRNTISNKA